MKLNKTVAIYFSPTHTTEKSLKAFAKGTGLPFEMVDLTTPRHRSSFKRSFQPNELVVVGLPVYAGRLPGLIDDFFANLEGNGAPAVAVVVYGNRDYDDSLLELKMKLESRSFKVRAAATFIGEHTFSSKIATGRPDANDLVTASDFGKRTILSIAQEIPGDLKFKGTYPFKAKVIGPGIVPTTSAECVLCGLCIDNCPWGAIDSNDCKKVDASKCMRCARCIKECPSGAKQFTDPGHLAFIPEFEKRLNTRRCEPELFLPAVV
jgi:ferredoxin